MIAFKRSVRRVLKAIFILLLFSFCSYLFINLPTVILEYLACGAFLVFACFVFAFISFRKEINKQLPQLPEPKRVIKTEGTEKGSNLDIYI